MDLEVFIAFSIPAVFRVSLGGCGGVGGVWGGRKQKQVEGVGDLLGDLVDICIRATGSQQRRQQRTTNNVGIHPASSSRVGSPPPQRSKDGTSSPVPLLGPTPAPTPPTVVARTLLLYRNLALAPSTGQVSLMFAFYVDLFSSISVYYFLGVRFSVRPVFVNS